MSKILITSALPYINGVKHLGNLAGSMLPADVYARAMRLLGHEVLYICATDEHGTPAELAAQVEGEETKVYCNAMHEAQKSAGDKFKLSYDYFGRSSSVSNHKLTQHFANTLEERVSSKNVYLNRCIPMLMVVSYLTGMLKVFVLTVVLRKQEGISVIVAENY